MKYFIAIFSCIVLAFVYYKLTQEHTISAETLQQIELNRSQNAFEKERRQYLITIMFQQTGITLLLFGIPMAFLLYQNRRIRKKLQLRITSFGSLSLFNAFSKQRNRSFSEKLTRRHPELTAKDLELCALLHRNVDSKTIASKFNIRPSSVYTARYRLRKKLDISSDMDLVSYLLQFTEK